MKIKIKPINIISFFLLSAAVCTGCAGCKSSGFSDKTWDDKKMSIIESEIIAEPFPEGVRLKNFYITHQGMEMEPYYLLKTADAGFFMKTTDIRPYDERILGSGSYAALDSAKYFAFADTVKECERADLIQTKDDKALCALEKAIAGTGALNWNGYFKNISGTGVSDSGDRYEMYIELSNGITVSMDSYNICPAGFMKLLKEVSDIFGAA